MKKNLQCLRWCISLSVRKQPKLNFAVIFDEGKVCHFSMNGAVPQARGVLFNLPRSNGYFGYSDDKGILYFIHSSIQKSITKFHKQLNRKGHTVVQGSKYKPMDSCKKKDEDWNSSNDQIKETMFDYTNVKSFCIFSSAVWKLNL